MPQTPLENLPRQSDLVVAEWDTRHTRETIDVSAYNHSAVANKPESLLGWLIKAGDVLALAADAANVTGIIIQADKLKRSADETTIDNKNADKFVIIRRGPAILKKSGINLTDTANAAITEATVITALKGLGITVIDDYPQTTVQTP